MKKLISIIDDDPEMGEVYTLMLEDLIASGDIDLNYFSDSREFVKWIQGNTPDLILSDVSMPYVSGPEICKLLKNKGDSVPTFLISGFEESEYKSLLRDVRVDRFLTKPVNYDQIIGIIHSQFGFSAPRS